MTSLLIDFNQADGSYVAVMASIGAADIWTISNRGATIGTALQGGYVLHGLDASSDWTVEADVNAPPTGTTTKAEIFMIDGANATQGIGLSTVYQVFTATGGGAVRTDLTADARTKTTEHITLTYASVTGVLTAYSDGVRVAQAATGSTGYNPIATGLVMVAPSYPTGSSWVDNLKTSDQLVSFPPIRRRRTYQLHGR